MARVFLYRRNASNEKLIFHQCSIFGQIAIAGEAYSWSF
jgi:hypothetical protein